MNLKVTCPFCRNGWYLDDEAIIFAMENSPKKGRSMGVECPRLSQTGQDCRAPRTRLRHLRRKKRKSKTQTPPVIC